ncbi:MAG: type II toxin-antitoxin system VapC family toxin [Verrucomicrobiota bacterium]
MKAYADSSVMAALYVQESMSAHGHLLVRNRLPLPFTPWHRLEVRNAIRKAALPAEAIAALRLLEQDVSEEMVVAHKPIDWTNCLRIAEQLSRDHNPKIGASSPDLFHVACALEMGFVEFFSFDRRQKNLAKAAGLKVKGL